MTAGLRLDEDTVRAPSIFKTVDGTYPRQGDSRFDNDKDGQYRGYYPETKSWSPRKSQFGDVRNTRPHDGIDIFAPLGTPILAPIPGTLVHIEKPFTKLGLTSLLQFRAGGQRWQLYFAHLSAQAGATRKITPAQVTAGEVIGYVGKSGNVQSGTSETGIPASHVHIVLEKILEDNEARRASRIDPAAALGWDLDPMEGDPPDAAPPPAPVARISERRFYSDPAAQTAGAFFLPRELGTPQIQVPLRFEAHAAYYAEIDQRLENDDRFAKDTVDAWRSNLSLQRDQFASALAAAAAAEKLEDGTWWGILIHGNNFVKGLMSLGVVVALPAAFFGTITLTTAAAAMAALSIGGLVYAVTIDTVVNALVLGRAQGTSGKVDPVYSVLGVPTNVEQFGVENGAGMPAVLTRAIFEEIAKNAGKRTASKYIGVVGGMVDLYAAGKSSYDRSTEVTVLKDKLKEMEKRVSELTKELEGADDAEIRSLLKAQAAGNAEFWREQTEQREDWSFPGAPIPRSQFIHFEALP